MTTIAILPEQGEGQLTFSAVATGRKATGRTVGEALDALTSQLSAEETGATVIVQQFRPDALFSAAQRDRLSELMTRWRAVRETGNTLPPGEQAELERLVDEEVQGSAERTAQILRDLEATPRLRNWDEARRAELARFKQEGRFARLHIIGLLALEVLFVANCALLIDLISADFILFAFLVVSVTILLLFRLGSSVHFKETESSAGRGERREQTKAR